VLSDPRPIGAKETIGRRRIKAVASLAVKHQFGQQVVRWPRPASPNSASTRTHKICWERENIVNHSYQLKQQQQQQQQPKERENEV